MLDFIALYIIYLQSLISVSYTHLGEKVRLRAYKEEDIPLATKFVNDRELKKLLVTNIPFPMTNWEEESWIKSQKSNDNGQYNFAIEDIETGKYIGCLLYTSRCV